MNTSIKNIILTLVTYSSMLLFLLCSCTEKGNYSVTNGTLKKEVHTHGSLNPNLNTEESLFLNEVAEANLLEIRLCKLAQKKSTNEDIKELAKMIELAQIKLQSELNSLALKKSIVLPTTKNDRVNIFFDNLNSESLHTFDNTFCDLMVKNNRNSIEMLDRALLKLNDAEINNWAANKITELVSSIDFAMTCQSKYQITSK